MDPAVLLQPKEEDAPSGANLEYDPAFTDMELAAQPGEETVIGDERTEATDPDYREVAVKATEVLERSHDLRAAVFLADALLQSEGLSGFADVTTFMRGCLEQYWDTCHPELDEDDGDPIMRINAVQDLCGQPGGMAGPSPVYRSLRRTPLSDSRGFGRFSLREMEVAEGIATAPSDMERVPDQATISAAFQDSDPEGVATRLAAAETAVENVKAISAVFDEQTPGQGPELDPLIKLLQQIAKRLRDYGNVEEGAEAPEADAAEEAEAGAAVAAPAAAAGIAPGAINSPADVSNMLDRIIGYYAREEPSSPVPLLLERAKRLVGADFLTIMNDMAPRGLENVQLIGGIEDDD
ncbi:type VI secretion system protein TssA [Phaeobacter gallaeciensis]|uniref:type VI secretion system protein TssA n=1 Tax=Rhodobacterales TaxID=204455 RepID=UPI00237FAB09|nr:type VI secretion system protein TssA [Phaeobacter gallaeciensis]MDE4310501.1 type VI secretion system protein TssA [Phaeobacter gallaeciensis]MDE4314966.1 type VI secretion system protein TssA [Phaeobacter gallaeciensis]MDE4319434.1 type VI secretion system protein TssA [Phaeobacter gallaeciensis]MDE4323814.1 type VI secretion system protein TssA [Phaeobacter gallaeciensis]MDE4328318.1 type VI secretion system protein TssA [Phaeobacter gallaeciensis]